MKEISINRKEELFIIIFSLIMLAYDFATYDGEEFKNLFELVFVIVCSGILYLATITVIVIIGKIIIRKINEWFKE